MMVRMHLLNTDYAARKQKKPSNYKHLHNVLNSDTSLTNGGRDFGKRARLYSSLKSARSSLGNRR